MRRRKQYIDREDRNRYVSSRRRRRGRKQVDSIYGRLEREAGRKRRMICLVSVAAGILIAICVLWMIFQRLYGVELLGRFGKPDTVQTVRQNDGSADGAGQDTGMNDISGQNAGSEAQSGTDGAEGSDGWSRQAFMQDRPKVKGIYVTGPRAGSAAMEDLISLVDDTELNAMVIDVKNDEGLITYQMDLEQAKELGACVGYIRDMDGLMKVLKEHGIYTIARIVCFKDPYLAASDPDLALKKPDGSNVTDGNGLAWVNPYKEGVWEYLTQVGEAAADAGFDEIQYDYVRFPVGDDADAADYGVDMNIYSKEQAIENFLAYASDRLHERDVPVTADVFGTVIGSKTDVGQVGQDYVKLGSRVDALCPMVYPSHYGNKVFGLEVPDAYPYETVLAALKQSGEELGQVPERDRAVVRPWLQAFTATWVKGHISYGGDEIRRQIQAVYDAGYEEWILWNATNRYSADGLETE